MAQLTGKALLDKIKELGDVTQDVVAKECGYVVTKKDGAVRFQYQALYQATLAAKGINFAPPASAKAGRKLSYKAVVQKSGNIIISKGYTELHGAEEGHEFKIELLEDGSFKLSPIYEDDEQPAAEPGDAAPASVEPVAA